MTDKTALRQLIEAVEAGNQNAAFWKVWRPENEGGQLAFIASRAYHGSLDAAKALHEALLPGYSANIWMSTDDDADCTVAKPHKMGDDPKTWLFLSDVEGNNPARAWLIAILKALEAQQ